MTPMKTQVLKEALLDCLQCPLCGRLCQKATTIVECLHTFCHRCITKRLKDGQENFCPECDVSLGHRPFEMLRLDRQIGAIRMKLFSDKLQEAESCRVGSGKFRSADNLDQSDSDLEQELHSSKMQIAELEAALQAERHWRISAEMAVGSLEHFWTKSCELFHKLVANSRYAKGFISEAKSTAQGVIDDLDMQENQSNSVQKLKNVQILLEKVDCVGSSSHFGSVEEIINAFTFLQQQQRQQQQRQQEQTGNGGHRDSKVVRVKRNSREPDPARYRAEARSLLKRQKVLDMKELSQRTSVLEKRTLCGKVQRCPSRRRSPISE